MYRYITMRYNIYIKSLLIQINSLSVSALNNVEKGWWPSLPL